MPTIAAPTATSTLTPNRAGAAGSNQMNSLASEDFYKLLITELQNQDPLEPTKTADMVNQVSQIRSIELSNKLAGSLDELAKSQRSSASSALLGKMVTAQVVDAKGKATDVSGVVTSIRFDTDGTTLIDLDSGQTVRADDIISVTTPESLFNPLSALMAAPQDAPTNPTNDAKAADAAKSKKDSNVQAVLQRLLAMSNVAEK